MDKRFMIKRTITISMLTLVMLCSQLTNIFAVSNEVLTDMIKDNPTVAIEVYEPVISQQIHMDFSDVPNDAWYYNSINEARQLGLVVGVGDNKYLPLEKITYAQYLTVIARILDKEVENQPITRPWYSRYIESAENLGAIDKNEEVPAELAIPREDMIRYSCKALGISPFTGNDIVFGDVDPKDAAYINAGYYEYLIEGGGRLESGLKKFGFGSYATRAELAAMAVRISQYMKNPTEYKKEAAEIREAADKAWEEQNEDLVDKAGLVKAEEIFNEIPIYQKNTNIGLKFGNTGYTLTDASLFAYNFLEVFLNYDGTDIKSMDEREAELLKYVTPGSAGDIAKSKQRAIETKDKCEIELFLSADRIEIKDGAFHVHAVVYDYVTNDVYKAYLGIGGHPVNTNDLAIGRWEFDLVK